LFDFWTDDVRRDHVDVMVAPAGNHVLKARLALQGMRPEVFVEDVQA
jgi:hypothetical protein